MYIIKIGNWYSDVDFVNLAYKTKKECDEVLKPIGFKKRKSHCNHDGDYYETNEEKRLWARVKSADFDLIKELTENRNEK